MPLCSPPRTSAFATLSLARGHGGTVPAQGCRLSQGRAAGMGRSAICQRHGGAYLLFPRAGRVTALLPWKFALETLTCFMCSMENDTPGSSLNHPCPFPAYAREQGLATNCSPRISAQPLVPCNSPREKHDTPPPAPECPKHPENILSPVDPGDGPSSPGLSTISHPLLCK